MLYPPNGNHEGAGPPPPSGPPQYHHEQPPPTHVAYSHPPPHIAYHHPPPPQPNPYHPRPGEVMVYPGQPMMYGHHMYGMPTNGNGEHHSIPASSHEGSHTARPSSRKSNSNISPAMTLASLEGSVNRKHSIASSNGYTPPAAGPSSQRQSGSTSSKKPNASVPKKRGRPPKVKTAEVTPSRTVATDTGDSVPRQAKRQRIVPPPPITPPPTSIVPLAYNDQIINAPPPMPINDDDAEEERRRKTLAITTHATDGRRLDCNQPYVDRQDYSTSRQRGPGLVMDDNGTASFDAGEAVSQELNWMESTLPSPPLTAENAAAKTPVMGAANIPDIEVTHTPSTRASNLEKRMQGFKSLSSRPQAAETRFVEGGRFITPGPGLTDLLMNPTHDQPSSKRPRMDDHLGSIVQPDWPEIPGSIAWPHQDPIREGNRRRELATIERYLALGESDSDDESAERFHIHIRRPASAIAGPSNLAARNRGFALIDGAPSDALLALRLTMRNRNFDHLETSSLACDCGNQYADDQAVVQCTSCRDIHHVACYPHRELPSNQWETFFCRACRERAMRHATPIQTPRAYVQSDIRSSAFKGDMAHRTEMAGIALMPSPIFPITARTPYGQLMGRAQSPRGPVHNRTLSFNDDPFFKYFEVPTTPAPAGGPRTPRDGGGSGFDVMSTPSRHLDYASLVRYPRPSDSRDRTMLSDSMGSFSTPPSSRVTSASGSAVRPMMMGSRPTMTPSVSITGPTTTLLAGPSSHAGRIHDIGIGSPPSTLQSHHLLGGALIMSPPSHRGRQVSKNNLSSLDVDSRGDLMGPMIDAAEPHDDER